MGDDPQTSERTNSKGWVAWKSESEKDNLSDFFTLQEWLNSKELFLSNGILLKVRIFLTTLILTWSRRSCQRETVARKALGRKIKQTALETDGAHPYSDFGRVLPHENIFHKITFRKKFNRTVNAETNNKLLVIAREQNTSLKRN